MQEGSIILKVDGLDPRLANTLRPSDQFGNSLLLTFLRDWFIIFGIEIQISTHSLILQNIDNYKMRK